MGSIPCRERTFPYTLDIVEFYGTYLRWFRHLNERLGAPTAHSLWEGAISTQEDPFLYSLLSSGWQAALPDQAQTAEGRIQARLEEYFSSKDTRNSIPGGRRVIEGTPPIPQIRQLSSIQPVQKEITAYAALHLRFDTLARLAEALIDRFGKQGELIVYDLMVADRLVNGKGRSGSVEEFISDFTSKPVLPSLFTAGLEFRLIQKTDKEAILDVQECEWARYFRERHPGVGYLMACSTDEVAYKAFNRDLRLQRTRTLMEGGQTCDFRIFSVDHGNPG